MAKTSKLFRRINKTLLAVANWMQNTRALRTQMMLSRHGVRFDKHGNVIGARNHVD